MAFDNKLTNARGALATDKTIYAPIQFQIISISNPTVTVKNADADGNTFIYNQTLRSARLPAPNGSNSTIRWRSCSPSTRKITATPLPARPSARASQNGDGTVESARSRLLIRSFTKTKPERSLRGEPTANSGVSADVGRPDVQGHHVGRHSGDDQIRRAVSRSDFKLADGG